MLQADLYDFVDELKADPARQLRIQSHEGQVSRRICAKEPTVRLWKQLVLVIPSRERLQVPPPRR